MIVPIVLGILSGCNQEKPASQPIKPVSSASSGVSEMQEPVQAPDTTEILEQTQDTTIIESSSSLEQEESSSSVFSSSSQMQVRSSSSRKSSPPKIIESSSSAEMDSTELSSSSAYCTEVPAGTVCDMRDGQIYRLTTIGSQVWMAQNLNFATPNSWCYNNNEENCAVYGRLYSWTAAVNLSESYATTAAGSLISEKHRGNCPEGFRLPNNRDMQTLVEFIQDDDRFSGENIGTRLKTQSWKKSEEWPSGTDRYGFGALAAGFRNSSGVFSELGADADFWVAEEGPSSKAAPYWNLYYDNDDFLGGYRKRKTYAYSVRCIKSN